MKYALLLNDMRQPNIENIEIVKISENQQELVDWYKSYLAPQSYNENGWYKVFIKGSPLEWFNPVDDIDKLNEYWGGIWEVKDTAQVGMALRKGYL